MDFVVLDDRRMLLASTQRWHDRMDIAYHVFNMMDVYGLNPANTQVSLSGEREIKTVSCQDAAGADLICDADHDAVGGV